jgi:hypothetical protein
MCLIFSIKTGWDHCSRPASFCPSTISQAGSLPDEFSSGTEFALLVDGQSGAMVSKRLGHFFKVEKFFFAARAGGAPRPFFLIAKTGSQPLPKKTE